MCGDFNFVSDSMIDRLNVTKNTNFNTTDGLSSFAEEIWLDSTRSPLEKVQLNNEEVFSELVSQRLAQGFQLILSQDGNEPFTKTPTSGSVMPRSADARKFFCMSDFIRHLQYAIYY